MTAVTKMLGGMAFGAALALAGASQAATLIHPVSAVSPEPSYPGFDASYAIDNAPNTDWASNGQGNNASLILDMGSVMKLTEAYVTDRVTSGGGNGTFVGGLYDFTTKFSLTPCADANCTVTGTPLVFTHTPPVNPTSASDFEINVALGGMTTQYLEYNVLDHLAPLGTNNTGLEDIAFSVPEPATWALMMFGVLAVGAGLRLNRRPIGLAI